MKVSARRKRTHLNQSKANHVAHESVQTDTLERVNSGSKTSKPAPELISDNEADLKKDPLKSPHMLPLLKLSLIPLFGAYVAWFSMWQDKAGNLVTGLGLGGWGDLLFHIRAAVFFSEQGGWPRESFFLSGHPVGYAFVSDFISALLLKAGLSMAAAFSVPTVVLVLLFLGLFEFVAFRFTKSVSAAILATLLFVCFGGLSGWSVVPELTPDSWTKLRDLPHGITVWREANYAVLNPFVMMLHQRAFLLGFPLLIGLIYLSWKFLTEKSMLALVLIVFAASLLALFHPFTWVAFLLIFASWMGWMILLGVGTFSRREITLTVIALGIISLAGFLIVKSLQPNAGASSISWRPGWLATDINWLYFWFKNIGLYLILGGVAVYFYRRRNPPLALLVLAGATPFLAANLFQFAPWDWDNTKIFAPVWIILSIGVGGLLVSLWESNELRSKALSMAILPTLILSGGLEVGRVLSYRNQPFTISTAADLAMGRTVRNQLGKKDVMLSEPEASHPVFMYSGRPSFVAYEGWLWSQGWQGQYEQRLVDKKLIYEGTDASRDLINRNDIAYVVIGPAELKAGANKPWFDSHYSQLLVVNDYTIYDVKREREAALSEPKKGEIQQLSAGPQQVATK